MTNTILLVEDNDDLRRSLTQNLRHDEFKVIEASAFIVAKDHVSKGFDGVVLTDIRMEGKDGFDVLELCQARDPELPVIMLTGKGDIQMAVRAIKLGAFDFLEKPCHPDKLVQVLKHAMEQRRLILQNRALKTAAQENDLIAQTFPGTSDLVTQLRKDLRRIKSTPAHIHIWGERGVGKKMAAKSLTQSNGASDVRTIDMARTDTSQLEALFLDPLPGAIIAERPEAAPQILQEDFAAKVEAHPKTRVITVSTQNKKGLLERTLISDLYFRIGLVEVMIPTLRDRPEDIPINFKTILEDQAKSMGMPEPSLHASDLDELLSSGVIGNLLELRQTAQRLILGLSVLPINPSHNSLADRLNAFEKTLLIEALEQHNGVTIEVSEYLKIPLKTLYDRMKKHDLKGRKFRMAKKMTI